MYISDIFPFIKSYRLVILQVMTSLSNCTFCNNLFSKGFYLYFIITISSACRLSTPVKKILKSG